MKNKSDKSSAASGPKDRSLEAFKVWIRKLITRFTSEETKIILTEEEWVRYWEEYWREQTDRS